MRFTIRDILWLTVVVAAALTLWLGWSRETATLRDEVAAERDKGIQKLKGIASAHGDLMVKSKMQEAIADRLRDDLSNRKSAIMRLEDEVGRLKAEIAGRSQAIPASKSN